MDKLIKNDYIWSFSRSKMIAIFWLKIKNRNFANKPTNFQLNVGFWKTVSNIASRHLRQETRDEIRYHQKAAEELKAGRKNWNLETVKTR